VGISGVAKTFGGEGWKNNFFHWKTLAILNNISAWAIFLEKGGEFSPIHLRPWLWWVCNKSTFELHLLGSIYIYLKDHLGFFGFYHYSQTLVTKYGSAFRKPKKFLNFFLKLELIFYQFLVRFSYFQHVFF